MRRTAFALTVALALALVAGAACAGDFFFVVLADTQLGMTDVKDPAPEAKNFTRAVEHINRLKPAFVIILGDMIHSARNSKQIRAFWQVAREIRKDVPLYLVPGNHDIGMGPTTAESVKSYTKLFGPDHYVFSYGGSEFIVLNSQLIQEMNGDPEPLAEQRKWFEERLGADREKKAEHIFVIAHHPWFVSDPNEANAYQNIPKGRRGEYLELMKRFGVDFALSGHLHVEASANYGSITLITTSSVGKALGSDPVGLRIVRVSGSRVESKYYALDEVPISCYNTTDSLLRR